MAEAINASTEPRLFHVVFEADTTNGEIEGALVILALTAEDAEDVALERLMDEYDLVPSEIMEFRADYAEELAPQTGDVVLSAIMWDYNLTEDVTKA